MKPTADRTPLRDQPVSSVRNSRRKVALIHRHSPLHRRLESPSQDTTPFTMQPDTALPSAPTGDSPRVLARMPVVLKMTGLGRSTIYRWIADGSFPPPVRLGPRAVAWRWSDLDQWTRSRPGTH